MLRERRLLTRRPPPRQQRTPRPPAPVAAAVSQWRILTMLTVVLLTVALAGLHWRSPRSPVKNVKGLAATGRGALSLSEPLRTDFPGFAQWMKENEVSGNEEKLRICIATFSLVGPTKNGGIATADTALAEALVSAGHKVTVLYLWDQVVQSLTIDHWVQVYRERGIELVPLPTPEMKISPTMQSKFVRVSYSAYLWLKERDGLFDAVHFHEWHGAGYYTVLAKHQGLAFAKTVLFTTIHCPALFYLDGSGILLSSENYLVSDFLERKQVELSDIVVSPSKFMLRWVQANNWKLPHNTFVQQNILSDSVFQLMEESSTSYDSSIRTVEEFVFFGRLEVLKGLFQFLEALDILAVEVRAGKTRNFSVSFMGNPNLGAGNNVTEIILARAKAKNWPFLPSFLTNKLQPEAISYLHERPGRVAIMPSLVENSPYAIVECIALRIPFMSSDAGGISELIDPKYHKSVLFVPRPKSIADKLRNALLNGISVAEGTVNPKLNRELWMQWHSAVFEALLGSKRGSETLKTNLTPLVTICMAHHNRGSLLLKTLDAILAQDYPNFELVIVDDGSDNPIALSTLKMVERDYSKSRFYLKKLGKGGLNRFKLVRQENSFPGAARNRAVGHANGDFVIFLDDDDIPRPTWLSTMVKVALKTNSDVVTSMCDFFYGKEIPNENLQPNPRWVTLGDAADIGLFENVFGAYAALVRKEVFWKIGGFSEDYGSTYEDYEFLANAVLSGFKLELVPEGLLWYRQTPGSHLMKETNQYQNRMRALRAYVNAVPSSLRNAILMGYGKVKKTAHLERRNGKQSEHTNSTFTSK